MIGVLVLLVGCRQGGDGTLNSRKDTDVMQNASASEDVPVIVVSAKREVDSQDRLGDPRPARTPTGASLLPQGECRDSFSADHGHRRKSVAGGRYELYSSQPFKFRQLPQASRLHDE
jgi:hypothetical protein